ncbi:MAG: type 2 isopentenyl-diphosphate Delta-isomerase [Nostoc indistinguendum CM1-VF10]|nr:type 2 isopentenyl-diphosphate Delta-isomerase [Nostoc indistinguendum CM1-VF10]
MARKNDHIRICATEDVESKEEPFSSIELIPEALPEFDFQDVKLEQNFLGKQFAMPILITGMTGGIERGQEINQILAIAAVKNGIPMGLGSQKIMVTRPELKRLFDVRKQAPNTFLIGNIGVVNFNYGITIEDIQRLVDSLELDAFAFHINALQECIQPEGERNFSGLLYLLEQAVKKLSIPIMVKEVGSGISAATFRKLVNCGVAAVDVGGRGGTSWSAIEGFRGDRESYRLGQLFRNWGLLTDQSLQACAEEKRRLESAVELVATGGIRNGLQVTKAVSLGAQMVGVGMPLFKAAVNPPPGMTGLEAVEKELSFFQRSLTIAMFCSGAQKLSNLESRVNFNTV